MPTTPADYVQAAALLALAGTGGTYAHESSAEATLTANAAALPLIVLADYTTNQQATTDRTYRANLSVFFGTSKPGQGDDPLAEAQAVGKMAQLKQRFLAFLDANPTVEITAIRAAPMHGVYEAMLSGLGIQFTLGVPAAPLASACLPPPGPDQAASPPLLPGYSDRALLLALTANGTARPGHENSSAYGSDYN